MGRAGEKPLIDTHCLCGKPHPCPAHGRWAGQWKRHLVEFNARLLIKLVMEADEPGHRFIVKEAG